MSSKPSSIPANLAQVPLFPPQWYKKILSGLIQGHFDATAQATEHNTFSGWPGSQGIWVSFASGMHHSFTSHGLISFFS
jgi:hypothetical protein